MVATFEKPPSSICPECGQDRFLRQECAALSHTVVGLMAEKDDLQAALTEAQKPCPPEHRPPPAGFHDWHDKAQYEWDRAEQLQQRVEALEEAIQEQIRQMDFPSLDPAFAATMKRMLKAALRDGVPQ